MKNLFTLNILIILSLSACLVKEPEPRDATIVNSVRIISTIDDHLQYTEPKNNEKANTISGNVGNFDISFYKFQKITLSNKTILKMFNDNEDSVSIYIQNLAERSANYRIIANENVSRNEAFISIHANAWSVYKFDLESISSTLHVYYDDILKNWTLSFDAQEFNHINGGGAYWLGGKMIVK